MLLHVSFSIFEQSVKWGAWSVWPCVSVCVRAQCSELILCDNIDFVAKYQLSKWVCDTIAVFSALSVRYVMLPAWGSRVQCIITPQTHLLYVAPQTAYFNLS